MATSGAAIRPVGKGGEGSDSLGEGVEMGLCMRGKGCIGRKYMMPGRGVGGMPFQGMPFQAVRFQCYNMSNKPGPDYSTHPWAVDGVD